MDEAGKGILIAIAIVVVLAIGFFALQGSLPFQTASSNAAGATPSLAKPSVSANASATAAPGEASVLPGATPLGTATPEAGVEGASPTPSGKVFVNGVEVDIASLPTAPPLKYCGNNLCEVGEDCFNCVSDCGCNSSEYCREGIGDCRPKEYCGDNICTAKEKTDASCCLDCGCGTGMACNQGTRRCAAQAKLNETQINSIATDFITKNSANYSTLSFVVAEDDFIGDTPVKLLIFDCSQDYACRVAIAVASNGTILDRLETT